MLEFLRLLKYTLFTCEIHGQAHFGLDFYICKPIFKLFVALFTNFGMQKNDEKGFRSMRYENNECKDQELKQSEPNPSPQNLNGK